MVRVFFWVLRCQIRNVLPHAAFPRGEFVEPTPEEVKLAAASLGAFDHVVHACPETGLKLDKPQPPKVWAQKDTKHITNEMFNVLHAAGLVTQAPDPEPVPVAEDASGVTVSLTAEQTVHGAAQSKDATTYRG